MSYEKIRTKEDLSHIKYSVQQQIRFNGNVFGNKCCRCNEDSLYSYKTVGGRETSFCSSPLFRLYVLFPLGSLSPFWFITKTCLFKYIENFISKNSDIFHISAQNIDCRYPLEPPWRGGSNEYPQSMF